MTTNITFNTTRIWDNDADTGVKSEVTADLDRVDLFAASSAGAENAIEITGDDTLASSLMVPYIKLLKHLVVDANVRIGAQHATPTTAPTTYIDLNSNPDTILFVAKSISMLNFDGAGSGTMKAFRDLTFAIGQGLSDLDGDTTIVLESVSDSDTIEFKVEGEQLLQLVGSATPGSGFISALGDIEMYDNAATQVGAKIGDRGLDTYIVFNESTSGTDDDTIRFYADGTEVMNITSIGMSLVVAGANFGTSGNVGVGVTSFPTGGDKGLNIAEGTRPTASNLTANEVFVTAVNNVGYAGQSDLYFDFKDSASTKKTVILGEDCTFPNDVTVANDLTITNNADITGTLSVDTINEKTPGNGVRIDVQTLIKDDVLSISTVTASVVVQSPVLITDIIAEQTGDNGVVIDGFKLRDAAPDPTVWPSFKAYRSVAGNDYGVALETLIFDTESFDTNSDYDETTGIFSPTHAGKYLLTATVTWKGSSLTTNTDDLRVVIIDQAATIHTDVHITSSGTSDDVSQVVSVIVDADGSADTFKIQLANTNNASRGDVVATLAATHFSGSRIA